MLIKKIQVALGAILGRALAGPIEVSIDLTRRCTLDCVMCWWRSPLLDKQPPSEWVNQELDYESFKKIIQDLKKLEVKKIILGGQGEPFMYSRLFDALEYAKSSGFDVSLISSGFFLNEKNIKTIFDLKIDCLDISLQAATAETYSRIHPSLPRDTFQRIKDQLLLLSQLKKKFNQAAPRVALIHVMCSLNYKDTPKVIEFADAVGAKTVGFKRIDVVPATKSLL